MAIKPFVYTMRMPAPAPDKQEGVEKGFLDFARRGGDQVRAEVIKGEKEWTFKASFTDPELAVQFTLALPGGEEALTREVQRHEDRKVADKELPEGAVLFAVLFDKHRDIELVLGDTTEEKATARGRELKAPVIVFVGAKHVGGIDSDLWIAGMCIDPSYGTPSKRIQEQMAGRALKEVITIGMEQGKALEAGAGRA
jgi:hypothetical protein